MIPSVERIDILNEDSTFQPGVLYHPSSSSHKGFDCVLEDLVFQIRN